MPWLQLHLTVEKQKALQIELLFESLGALSVTLKDAADEALLEPAPGESPLWRKTRVSGLFSTEQEQNQLRREIDKALGNDIGQTIEWESLEDQQWERAWLEDFHPMKFGRNLWICPDGQRPELEDGCFIDLDPGLAFGTGTHPTTALCLDWLDGQHLEETSVMDYGCGSGILAIAALKLGAHEVVAVDHDPQALEASLANGEKNGVLSRLRVFPSTAVPAIKVDIMVANILAGTLIELEPMLAAHIKPRGRIILSGLLSDQSDEVSAAYTADFEMLAPITLENWVLLEGRRRQA